MTQLDFLLADYRSIKSEIARRSNLQRVALAGHVTLVALGVRHLLLEKQLLIVAAAIWAVSALTLLFYVREHLEISRLGHLVRDCIVPSARKILGGNIDCRNLLPSEADLDSPEKGSARCLEKVFIIGLFLFLPFAISVYCLFQQWSTLIPLCRNIHFLSATAFSFLAFLTILYALAKRF